MKNMFLELKLLVVKILNPKGRTVFINSIVNKAIILDVGCGNNSPYKVKKLRPDIYYIGLDIDIINQSIDSVKYADELNITTPEEFHMKIEEYHNTFDSIICSHNLEHCNDFLRVTLAMINALKTDGTLYLSFPCEDSINFPRRNGTLNFYDDITHKTLIPYLTLMSILQRNRMNILFTTKRYKPRILFFLGLIFEPISKFIKKQAPLGGTWAYYGFETIIIAKKH